MYKWQTDNLERVWNSGTDKYVDRPLFESAESLTELARHSIETDDFWKCDIYQVYSVGTSNPNRSEPLTLWVDDLLVGFRASDTTGFFEGDYVTQSREYIWWGDTQSHAANHLVRFSIKHTDLDGRTRFVVNNQELYGGDAESGVRYSSFYPSKPGIYTVTFNKILQSGGCAIPEPAPNNFWSYSVEFVPPSDDSQIPFGVDSAEIAAAFNQYQQQQQQDDSTVKSISAGYVFGTVTAITLVVYTIFDLMFKRRN